MERLRFSDDAGVLTPRDVAWLLVDWSRRPSVEGRLRMLTSARSTILAWAGSELVGVVAAIGDGVAWLYVSLLEVHPDHRGRGIGSELMRHMLDRHRDIYAIDVSCDDELVPFYERLGMRRLNAMTIRNPAGLP